jgi:hypothetical protein
MTFGGAGGFMTFLAASSWIGGGPPPPQPVVPATDDGAIFQKWALDEQSVWADDAGQPLVPNCSWWNGTVVYSSDLCSHFSLSRMATNIASRATDRALRCAAWHETECVISPEIGVSIPAAFVYDPSGEGGMRMLIAPRIVDNGNDTRTIRVQDPEEKTNGRVLKLNHTITVEYLLGGSRTPVSEVLNGSDAFCVQLLRSAFVDECWQHLD